MVLIDGLPIVSGLSSVYGFSGIPQFLVERVEIVKGPVSTLYGSEAIGGVINLITKLPENTPNLNVESFVSGWGEVNTDIGIKYRLSNNSSGLLGINYFNYSNPIDKNQDGFTDLTLQDRISIFNKIKSLKPKRGKEIHITDAIQQLINDDVKFIAHNFEGKYLDCGTMNGYINSSIEIGKLWNCAWLGQVMLGW